MTEPPSLTRLTVLAVVLESRILTSRRSSRSTNSLLRRLMISLVGGASRQLRESMLVVEVDMMWRACVMMGSMLRVTKEKQ